MSSAADLVEGGNVIQGAGDGAAATVTGGNVMRAQAAGGARRTLFALGLFGFLAGMYWIILGSAFPIGAKVTATATAYTTVAVHAPVNHWLLALAAGIILFAFLVIVGMRVTPRQANRPRILDVLSSLAFAGLVTALVSVFAFLLGIVLVRPVHPDMEEWAAQRLHVANLDIPAAANGYDTVNGRFYALDTAGRRVTLDYEKQGERQTLTFITRAG